MDPEAQVEYPLAVVHSMLERNGLSGAISSEDAQNSVTVSRTRQLQGTRTFEDRLPIVHPFITTRKARGRDRVAPAKVSRSALFTSLK